MMRLLNFVKVSFCLLKDLRVHISVQGLAIVVLKASIKISVEHHILHVILSFA